MQILQIITILSFGMVACSYPDNICTLKSCQYDSCEIPECKGGYVKPNTTKCGCCPTCVKLLGRGDPCHQVEIPTNAECGASLTCSEKSGNCVPLSLGAPFPSMKPLGPKRPIPCLASNSTLWQGDSKCSPDGSYAPKQCNAKFCMCVTRHGEVLPYSQPHKTASNMECLCARVEHVMSHFSGQQHLMCDMFGNYKHP